MTLPEQYAHDYRDMAMSEEEMRKMLEEFSEEIRKERVTHCDDINCPECNKVAYEAGVKAEREKSGQSKLDQKVVDAYENFMWNVDEAIRFVGIGAGSRMAGNIKLLQTLIAQHKKDCFDTIEKSLFPDNNKEV